MEKERLAYLRPLSGERDEDYLHRLCAEKDRWPTFKNQDSWVHFFQDLPSIENSKYDLNQNSITLSTDKTIESELYENLKQKALTLGPWKKGPFNLYGMEIDAEWRSDFKWNRLSHALGSLEGKSVLDIGCNNGYFMFRALGAGAQFVLGIDPVLPCMHQFQFINHFVKSPQIHFELWGVEDVKAFKNSFDVILHMGIIYHHRHPLEQLIDIREALKPGGTAIIETIGIAGEESVALFPEDRYAGMKNIYFVPTLSCLINWAHKSQFINIEVIDDTLTTTDEQRPTEWANKNSLEHALDPNDPLRTIEGYPAPRRMMIKVQKK